MPPSPLREGQDFVEWDKAGHGRAFISGQWSDVSTSEISTTANHDHTLDLNIQRSGANECLLHILHPGAGFHSLHAAAPHQMSDSHVQRQGTLRERDTGPAVNVLQTQLAQLGMLDSHGRALKPDSHFGADTKAAVETFQRSRNLHVDGIAGAKTLEAISTPAQSQPLLNLTDASHPGNPMYLQSLEAVYRLDALHGRTPDQRSGNLAGVVAVAAHGNGMTGVDHVLLTDDASRAFAVQGALDSTDKRFTHVDVSQAINTPLVQSSAQWHNVQEQTVAQAPPPTQQVQSPQANQPVMRQ